MLSKEKENQLSKYVSYILRHNPEEIGIQLDEQGWTNVIEFIKKSQSKYVFNLEDLKQVVENLEIESYLIDKGVSIPELSNSSLYAFELDALHNFSFSSLFSLYCINGP